MAIKVIDKMRFPTKQESQLRNEVAILQVSVKNRRRIPDENDFDQVAQELFTSTTEEIENESVFVETHEEHGGVNECRL